MLCMWEVYQLKLPSSFSEPGLLAYDGPPVGNKGGKAEEMFLSPIYLQDKRYHRCFTHRKSERLVRRGNRKNKQTLSVWKTLHGMRLWAMFDSCFSFPGHFFSISTSKEALYKGNVLSRVSIKLSIFPTKSSNIKNCSSEREQPKRRRKRENIKTISRIERAAHFLADFFAVRVLKLIRMALLWSP